MQLCKEEDTSAWPVARCGSIRSNKSELAGGHDDAGARERRWGRQPQPQSLSFLTFHSENKCISSNHFHNSQGSNAYTPSDLLSAVTTTCHFLSPTEYLYSFATKCLYVLLARRILVRILCQCQEREFSIASSPLSRLLAFFLPASSSKSLGQRCLPPCVKSGRIWSWDEQVIWGHPLPFSFFDWLIGQCHR